MKGSIFRHPTPLPLGVSSGYVMTVLGPLPISEMGVTLMHEHILLDASGKWVPPCCCSDRHLAEMPVKMENLGELSLNPLMSRDNCQLFDVDVAIEELTKYRALGGETVVDPTNIGIGRDPNALARIAVRVPPGLMQFTRRLRFAYSSASTCIMPSVANLEAA